MMDASTCEMLYKLDEQLSVISEFMTIHAGDILFTGSPSGSAAEHGGCWLNPEIASTPRLNRSAC
jgi:2,4-diketo-3-deoxy-L-fuconate hydrolase